MENLKLVHQLFIDKVADEIGIEKTKELLKEVKEAFAIPDVVQAKPEKVCKGSMRLGTGCGKCKKCKRELEYM